MTEPRDKRFLLLRTLRDIKELPDAEEGRIHLAMVPHGWAKNRNAFKAYKAAREHMAYAPKRTRAVIFDTPDDAFVGDMGSILWGNGDDEIHEVGEYHFTNRSIWANA